MAALPPGVLDRPGSALYRARMDVADLLAPVPLDRFEAETFGRKPLHLPASDFRLARIPLDWEEMNRLLAIRSHWSEANIKLIMNSRPIQSAFYMDETETLGGPARRANPAKVDMFLAMGASLVANSIEEISPRAAAIATALGDHYSAASGANAYCSFPGVQAFASHCDLHDVFAIQCEGEKIWRIYENRAESPVAALSGDDAQAVIDSAKGRVCLEVRMRRGDLLYIPRGYYHDALASGEASLHVSFALAPLTGRILFRLLEELAIEDAEFRTYLPDARLGGRRILVERLAVLAARASDLLRSERFAAELGRRQRGLVTPGHHFRLPERARLTFYARTERKAELGRDSAGTFVASATGRIAIGDLGEPAEWMLARNGFAIEELAASFQAFEETELNGLVGKLERLGLINRYTPKVE